MKKILFILLLIILVIGTSGCLKQTPSNADVGNDSEPRGSIEKSPDLSIHESGETELGGVGEEAEEDEEETTTDTVLEEAESPETGQEDASEIKEVGETDDEEEEISDESALSANIIIKTPLPNSILTSPFEIRGQARVFEGTVLIRVKNQYGRIVIPEQIAQVHSPEVGEFGPFKIILAYQFHATKSGTIEVFSQSPEDGSEINIVEIPVRFE